MSLKQTYICPYDGKTNIIKIYKDSDSIFTQVQQGLIDKTKTNPSKIFKFVECPTANEQSVIRELPMHKKYNVFYKAKDVWEFDNVGVSKPPKDSKDPEIFVLKSAKNGEDFKYAVVRYLVCGDCDKGAFGFGGYRIDEGAITENDEIDERLEVGYNFDSANPNHLDYFFYI